MSKDRVTPSGTADSDFANKGLVDMESMETPKLTPTKMEKAALQSIDSINMDEIKVNGMINDDMIRNQHNTRLPSLDSERSVELPNFNMTQPQMKSFKSTPMIRVTSPRSTMRTIPLKSTKKIITRNRGRSVEEVKHSTSPLTRIRGRSVDGRDHQHSVRPSLNKNHLSVQMIKLKKGGYTHKQPALKRNVNSAVLRSKHRQSVTLPNVPFPSISALNVERKENEPDIRFADPILPSQIHKIQDSLPPNCELGMFQMTDMNTKTKQQVVLVKYLKIQNKESNNNNPLQIQTNIAAPYSALPTKSTPATPATPATPVTPSLNDYGLFNPYNTIKSRSPSRTKTFTQLAVENGGINQFKQFNPYTAITSNSGGNSIEPNSPQYTFNDIKEDTQQTEIEETVTSNASPSITKTYNNQKDVIEVFMANNARGSTSLKLHNNISTSAKWLERVMFTVNEIFAPDQRFDDGMCIDFDEDEFFDTGYTE